LIDPKSDPSLSKVVQQMTLKYYNGGKLYSSHLERDSTQGYVNRHTPIGNEGKVATGIKDDPVPSHNQSVPRLNPGPRLPTKVPFKGGSPPSTPNPSFFLASPNLGDEIPFKGGSM
jgi:hypothetical protein